MCLVRLPFVAKSFAQCSHMYCSQALTLFCLGYVVHPCVYPVQLELYTFSPHPRKSHPNFLVAFPSNSSHFGMCSLCLFFFLRRESINFFTFWTGHRVGNFMCCCHVSSHYVLLIIALCLVILAIFAAFHFTNMCGYMSVVFYKESRHV